MSRPTLDTASLISISCTGLSPSMDGLSRTVPLSISVDYAVRTPVCTHTGLGSSAFARRYLRNHFYFLFLRLLRCFSSPGSLRIPMDSVYGTQGLLVWVSPFGYLRVDGYLLLTAAFRSLSRPSSALSAKASTLRSCLLNHKQIASRSSDSSVSPLLISLVNDHFHGQLFFTKNFFCLILDTPASQFPETQDFFDLGFLGCLELMYFYICLRYISLFSFQGTRY